MNINPIILKLPYSAPFLFVDEITHIDDEGVTGNYRFPENSNFYPGHFKNNPVTPGVILTECMAQIGVVCLGIYLLENVEREDKDLKIAMSSTEIDFFLPVYPGEKVEVVSKKQYFRFNKLKCDVEMFNAEKKLVCKGKIAGMVF
ncbi:beta-hydroxyacyl-ACP dehydratase [soil metagenome]